MKIKISKILKGKLTKKMVHVDDITKRLLLWMVRNIRIEKTKEDETKSRM